MAAVRVARAAMAKTGDFIVNGNERIVVKECESGRILVSFKRMWMNRGMLLRLFCESALAKTLHLYDPLPTGPTR